MDIDLIASRFGGYSEMARVMNVPVSTIHAWKRRGRVPAWRVQSIETALKNVEAATA